MRKRKTDERQAPPVVELEWSAPDCEELLSLIRRWIRRRYGGGA